MACSGSMFKCLVFVVCVEVCVCDAYGEHNSMLYTDYYAPVVLQNWPKTIPSDHEWRSSWDGRITDKNIHKVHIGSNTYNPWGSRNTGYPEGHAAWRARPDGGNTPTVNIGQNTYNFWPFTNSHDPSEMETKIIVDYPQWNSNAQTDPNINVGAYKYNHWESTNPQQQVARNFQTGYPEWHSGWKARSDVVNTPRVNVGSNTYTPWVSRNPLYQLHTNFGGGSSEWPSRNTPTVNVGVHSYKPWAFGTGHPEWHFGATSPPKVDVGSHPHNPWESKHPQYHPTTHFNAAHHGWHSDWRDHHNTGNPPKTNFESTWQKSPAITHDNSAIASNPPPRKTLITGPADAPQPSPVFTSIPNQSNDNTPNSNEIFYTKPSRIPPPSASPSHFSSPPPSRFPSTSPSRFSTSPPPRFPSQFPPKSQSALPPRFPSQFPPQSQSAPPPRFPSQFPPQSQSAPPSQFPSTPPPRFPSNPPPQFPSALPPQILSTPSVDEQAVDIPENSSNQNSNENLQNANAPAGHHSDEKDDEPTEPPIESDGLCAGIVLWDLKQNPHQYRVYIPNEDKSLEMSSDVEPGNTYVITPNNATCQVWQVNPAFGGSEISMWCNTPTFNATIVLPNYSTTMLLCVSEKSSDTSCMGKVLLSGEKISSEVSTILDDSDSLLDTLEVYESEAMVEIPSRGKAMMSTLFTNRPV